jgi:hypothetical protein
LIEHCRKHAFSSAQDDRDSSRTVRGSLRPRATIRSTSRGLVFRRPVAGVDWCASLLGPVQGFGPLDRSNQGDVRNLLRSDTPPSAAAAGLIAGGHRECWCNRFAAARVLPLARERARFVLAPGMAASRVRGRLAEVATSSAQCAFLQGFEARPHFGQRHGAAWPKWAQRPPPARVPHRTRTIFSVRNRRLPRTLGGEACCRPFEGSRQAADGPCRFS